MSIIKKYLEKKEKKKYLKSIKIHYNGKVENLAETLKLLDSKFSLKEIKAIVSPISLEIPGIYGRNGERFVLKGLDKSQLIELKNALKKGIGIEEIEMIKSLDTSAEKISYLSNLIKKEQLNKEELKILLEKKDEFKNCSLNIENIKALIVKSNIIEEGEELAKDYDNDGLSNRDEKLLGTNEKERDTDFDGRTDLEEVLDKTNPKIKDKKYKEENKKNKVR